MKSICKIIRFVIIQGKLCFLLKYSVIEEDRTVSIGKLISMEYVLKFVSPISTKQSLCLLRMGLNEAVDLLAMSHSVHRYGHVLGRVLVFEAEG